MEILEQHLASQGKIPPPPQGPRSQGGVDMVPVQDENKLSQLPPMRFGDARDTAATPDPRVINDHIRLLATFGREHVLVRPDAEVLEDVTQWLASLKLDFQTVRLSGKRTWPHFLEALYSGHLSKGDCEVLYYLRKISVVCGAVYPVGLGDAPLDTAIVRDGVRVLLGDACVVRAFAPDDHEDVVDAAACMFLDTKATDAVLASKIATRATSLRAWRAQ
jgi:hypothetical protein